MLLEKKKSAVFFCTSLHISRMEFCIEISDFALSDFGKIKNGLNKPE